MIRCLAQRHLAFRGASAAPVLERRFSQADADGSGALDRYEFNSPGWRPFAHEPD